MFGLEVARPGSGPARTPSAYVATACPPSPSPRCATRPRNRRANRGVSVNPSTDRPTCPYAGVLSSSTMSRSPFGTSLRNCTLSSSSATCWNAAGTIGYVFPLDEYRSSSPQQLLCQFTARTACFGFYPPVEAGRVPRHHLGVGSVEVFRLTLSPSPSDPGGWP